eukprot:TRINITY_DN223_c0_g1_i3.p1 TRINITY_DN223_c0_g1~~TRINITY_DN223_c0_g1_i3.p1  ORF type:complete len:174 (-),score=26.90 TRINITY_DN223_c0_g1_i3:111-632(-)
MCIRDSIYSLLFLAVVASIVNCQQNRDARAALIALSKASFEQYQIPFEEGYIDCFDEDEPERILEFLESKYAIIGDFSWPKDVFFLTLLNYLELISTPPKEAKCLFNRQEIKHLFEVLKFNYYKSHPVEFLVNTIKRFNTIQPIAAEIYAHLKNKEYVEAGTKISKLNIQLFA